MNAYNKRHKLWSWSESLLSKNQPRNSICYYGQRLEFCRKLRTIRHTSPKNIALSHASAQSKSLWNISCHWRQKSIQTPYDSTGADQKQSSCSKLSNASATWCKTRQSCGTYKFQTQKRSRPGREQRRREKWQMVAHSATKAKSACARNKRNAENVIVRSSVDWRRYLCCIACMHKSVCVCVFVFGYVEWNAATPNEESKSKRKREKCWVHQHYN